MAILWTFWPSEELHDITVLAPQGASPKPTVQRARRTNPFLLANVTLHQVNLFASLSAAPSLNIFIQKLVHAWPAVLPSINAGLPRQPLLPVLIDAC